jgi:hypothetical protein
MAASRRDDQASSGSAGGQDSSPVERATGQTQSDGDDFTHILNGIPGAWERAQESIMQAKCGKTVLLPEL